MPRTKKTSRLKKFWRERAVGLVVGELKQGITPEKISLTIALGITLGIFPILGATTLLCFIAGICFKLNQPVIQIVNYLVSALQLLMILAFVRIGEFIMRAPAVHFSITEMLQKFRRSPVQFFQEFGLTGLHGIIGWMLAAPILAAALYFSLLPLLKKLARRHPK